MSALEIMGMPLPFEEAEYAGRVDAARHALADGGLDAVLLFHQESQHYLFGYDQLGYWIYQAAVLTADSRDVTLVIRPLDFDLVNGLPFVRDIRMWRDDSDDDPARMTRDVLHDLGVLGAGKRIGIELRSHALLPYYYRRLEAELRGSCELVDASDLVTDLRVRKSDAEVAYVRAAGRYLDAAYAAAFSFLRPGVREAEVLAEAFGAMLRAGGDVPAVVPPLGSGPRTLAKTHVSASQRVVQDDELLVLQVGACAQRYHAVGIHSKWLGTPPAQVNDSFRRLIEARRAGLEAMKPGVRTAEVAKRVNETLTRHGIPAAGKHVGYGIGIGFPPTWADNMRIKETDPNVLEANMTFQLFVHHQLEHASAPLELFIGAPVLVTEAGGEELSETPFALELA